MKSASIFTWSDKVLVDTIYIKKTVGLKHTDIKCISHLLSIIHSFTGKPTEHEIRSLSLILTCYSMPTNTFTLKPRFCNMSGCVRQMQQDSLNQYMVRSKILCPYETIATSSRSKITLALSRMHNWLCPQLQTHGLTFDNI